MPKMLDRIRMVQRGECDVHDDKDRHVGRASSSRMTRRGAQAEGR